LENFTSAKEFPQARFEFGINGQNLDFADSELFLKVKLQHDRNLPRVVVHPCVGDSREINVSQRTI
jgi:hypothetical protein